MRDFGTFSPKWDVFLISLPSVTREKRRQKDCETWGDRGHQENKVLQISMSKAHRTPGTGAASPARHLVFQYILRISVFMRFLSVWMRVSLILLPSLGFFFSFVGFSCPTLMWYLLLYLFVFFYISILSLRSLFSSSERQEGHESGWRWGEEEMEKLKERKSNDNPGILCEKKYFWWKEIKLFKEEEIN